MIGDGRRIVVLAGVLLALAPIAVYARLGMVVLLAISVLSQPGILPLLQNLRGVFRNPMALTGTALAVWGAVTLAWAPAPSPVVLLRVFLVPLMGVLLARNVMALSENHARLLGRFAAAAGVALLALLAVEVGTGGFILAMANPEAAQIVPDVYTPEIINMAARGAAVLAPLSFAFAALFAVMTDRKAFGLLFLVAAFGVCAATAMQASWAAMLVGAVAFVAAIIAPRFALAAFMGGLVLYTLTAPVISATVLTLEGRENLGELAWRSMEQRIGIWHHVAGLVAERPVLGYGFDATRALSPQSPMIPGTNWMALPLHPHNAIMQVWLELGGIGAVLTAALLALAARALWPLTTRPLHLAIVVSTMTATAFIALISYGIWQYWWLATWGFAAAVACLALRLLPPRIQRAAA